MVSKTSFVPPAVSPAAARTSAHLLFPSRPRRLATGLAPAAFIVLVWVALWAWVSFGVAAPLSRMGSPERVQETSVRS